MRRGTSAPVTRVGMRASRAAAIAGGDEPVAMLGVAGGVAPYVQVGDVVVATEVRSGGVVVECASAALLAGALRKVGLTVHLGPIETRRSVARGDDFARLAMTGAVAVDMESATVAEAVGSRPFAAVRVITDTAAAPLTRPGIVRDGYRALRTLTRVAPVMSQWAAAARDREVRLAAPRSFCAGVERAIDIVQRALDRYGAPIYVRRQIVHNAHIVAELERRGAVFVEELGEVPDGARVIFAAHGVTPAVRDEASNRGLSVIDATCPLVAKVHSEVRRYAARDATVFLIGHRDHEEVVGTVGEAAEHVVVVDGESEAERAHADDPDNVAYVMQTTLAVDEAERIAAKLRQRFPALVAPRSDDICYATSNRQVAVREIAAESELVLVVGSANSSNSQRLVEVARRAGAQSHLVDDVTDIDLDWLRGVRRIGITAGASAPPHLVDEIVHCLHGLGGVDVREISAVEENVTFTLPREVS
ncbi:MAG TPA: 4-hydroxy-3-methylbut-2-enyl diphosphate reductase [Mycobacteriales bacterium]|nr:4-hydroxy-3-methylbut-2-enyl diphosphate reductase [Mycobacteriales bacterium]